MGDGQQSQERKALLVTPKIVKCAITGEKERKRKRERKRGKEIQRYTERVSGRGRQREIDR